MIFGIVEFFVRVNAAAQLHQKSGLSPLQAWRLVRRCLEFWWKRVCIPAKNAVISAGN
jgi:hypothetical protein